MQRQKDTAIFDEVFELSGLDVLTDHSALGQQDHPVKCSILADLVGIGSLAGQRLDFRLDPVVIYLRFLVAGIGGIVIFMRTIGSSLLDNASSRAWGDLSCGSA